MMQSHFECLAVGVIIEQYSDFCVLQGPDAKPTVAKGTIPGKSSVGFGSSLKVHSIIARTVSHSAFQDFFQNPLVFKACESDICNCNENISSP